MAPAATDLFLLDTNVIIALARGGQLAERIDSRTAIRNSPLRPLISIVSHGEVLAFVQRNAWGTTKRRHAENWLSQLVTVDINDRRIIQGFVQVKLATEPHGRILSDNDLWIAATAHATGAMLLTTDRDFDFLDGNLITRIYFDPRAPS